MRYLICLLTSLTALTLNAATYYIDYGAANDSANGTSTSTPWKRCPGMEGFNGTYSHSAGDRFIFKGGVTWPSACLPLTISTDGTSGSRDYYGYTNSWYSGGAWSRPVLDGEHNIHVVVYFNGGDYVTMDNLDIKGIAITANNGDSVIKIDSGIHLLFTNLLVHDWTFTTADGDSTGGIVNASSNEQEDIIVSHCDIGNPEHAGATRAGQGAYCIGTVEFSKIHDVSQGAIHGCLNIHDNQLYNIGRSCNGAVHCNVTFMAMWGHDTMTFYNNYLYGDIGNAMLIYPTAWGTGAKYYYIFNNVVISHAENTSGCVDVQTSSGVGSDMNVYIFNNTFFCQGNDGVKIEEDDGKKVYVWNNIVTDGKLYSTGGPYGTPTSTNCNYLYASAAAAASAGIGTNNLWRPSAGAAVIAAGTNLTSAASSMGIANLTSDSSIGNLTTPKARGSSWDIGALQYAAGSTTPASRKLLIMLAQ